MATKVKFTKVAKESSLPATSDSEDQAGSLYFVTETGNIYLDGYNVRHKMTPEYKLTTEDNGLRFTAIKGEQTKSSYIDLGGIGGTDYAIGGNLGVTENSTVYIEKNIDAGLTDLNENDHTVMVNSEYLPLTSSNSTTGTVIVGGNGAQPNLSEGTNATIVGANTSFSATNNTVVGTQASATGDNASAIGAQSEATGVNSVALGYNSKATGDDVVSVGNNEESLLRRITGVFPATLDKDGLKPADADSNDSQNGTSLFDAVTRYDLEESRIHPGDGLAIEYDSTNYLAGEALNPTGTNVTVTNSKLSVNYDNSTIGMNSNNQLAVIKDYADKSHTHTKDEITDLPTVKDGVSVTASDTFYILATKQPGTPTSETTIYKMPTLTYAGDEYGAWACTSAAFDKLIGRDSDGWSVGSVDGLAVGDDVLMRCYLTDTKEVRFVVGSIVSIASTVLIIVKSTGSLANPPAGWTTTEPPAPDTYTGNEYRCIRTTLSDGTALWTTPTVVASFSFAQKAYQTATGAVSKYSSTKDTVDSWVKSFGEDFSGITGEGWKAGTTLAQTAKDITLKADSSYVEQVGVGGRNLLRYTNRYDFTGEYDAPTFGLSTTGAATTLRTAYLDGETYYLSPRAVYTTWAESRFVDGTDSWSGDYTGYGWAVGDKVLWRFKASDTGKCMYQVLTVTEISSSKVSGTTTFSDMAGATWGWQVRVTKAPSSWHYFYAYDSYGTMKDICDDGAEYYTVSCRMKASVATSDSPLQNLVIENGDATDQAYSHVDSTGQLTAGKWCFVSGTVKRIEGASYSSQVIYFKCPALAAAGVTLEVKDLKIERGRQATDWTSAPEDGDLVTSAQIKVESDSILSTVSEKYATKDGSGTKESDVRQLSDSVTTQFTSLKGAITEWIADPDFKQGAANVDSWMCAPATSGMTQNRRDNRAGAVSDHRQLSKGTIIRCEATVNCASMADGCMPNVIMFVSPTADDDYSTWPRIAQGTKGSKTVQKLFGYYTVPDAYDGWWFRVGTQIAAETASGATGSVTWTHVRVTDVTSATEDSTLIHQTSDGVAVGKGTQAADGTVTWTDGQFHTLQGNGTFQVQDASGNEKLKVDNNRYLYTNYINSDTGNNENPTVSQIIVTNGNDNYYRKASASHVISSSLTKSHVINALGYTPATAHTIPVVAQSSTPSDSAVKIWIKV